MDHEETEQEELLGKGGGGGAEAALRAGIYGSGEADPQIRSITGNHTGEVLPERQDLRGRQSLRNAGFAFFFSAEKKKKTPCISWKSMLCFLGCDIDSGEARGCCPPWQVFRGANVMLGN